MSRQPKDSSGKRGIDSDGKAGVKYSYRYFNYIGNYRSLSTFCIKEG